MVANTQDGKLNQAKVLQELALEASLLIDAHQMIIRFRVEQLEQKTEQVLQFTENLEKLQVQAQQTQENIKKLTERLVSIESQVRQQQLTHVPTEQLVNLVKPFTKHQHVAASWE